MLRADMPFINGSRAFSGSIRVIDVDGINTFQLVLPTDSGGSYSFNSYAVGILVYVSST